MEITLEQAAKAFSLWQTDNSNNPDDYDDPSTDLDGTASAKHFFSLIEKIQRTQSGVSGK